jgi:UDP-N-acetyl-D-mannosaminuronic acid dehydrogenase
MRKVCIIGGCGHVGIPLGLAFASKGVYVTLLDINKNMVNKINKGILPFHEEHASEILNKYISKNLIASTEMDLVANQDVVIFVTGTLVDEHHNPRINDVIEVISSYLDVIKKEQLIILRSTIYPGTTDIISKILCDHFGNTKLAFCPERILQGKGMEEIFTLPQIIAANTDTAFSEASCLFSMISPKIIRLKPKEAELVKLIANTWRYIEFATANAFYMMVESEGLDYYTVFNALRDDYPRAQHFPKAGLTAGPCLFKDTMQLSTFNKNNFFLGQAAMLINEGLPNFLVEQLEKQIGPLTDKNIGLLGMTFKANNDDTRESLSFKIKKTLEYKMAHVLVTDPYLTDTIPLHDVLKKADGIILATPHDEYKNISIHVPCIDCWDFLK